MKLTQEQVDFLTTNENMTVASSSNDVPRAIMVTPSVVCGKE